MPGARQGNRRKDRDTFDIKPLQRSRQSAKQPEKEKPAERTAPSKSAPSKDDTESSPIDLSTTVPLSLQQLLLDVFKTALLTDPVDPHTCSDTDADTEPQTTPLDTKTLIQTIKQHLYQRDFDSAFAEAGGDLLRAYALRWSAARALGYAGILKAVLGWMRSREKDGQSHSSRPLSTVPSTRVICIGGGAGAEIVALAAAWRDLRDSEDGDDGLNDRITSLGEGVKGVSLVGREEQAAGGENGSESVNSGIPATSTRLSVAAVDIADWSIVVDRLSKTIASPLVPTSRTSTHQPPLLSGSDSEAGVSISFSRRDVLTLPESDLKTLTLGPSEVESTPTSSATPSLLVTLMFTLNELFTTSMPKTTGLLLKLTEILPTDAVLLVVDSPGSYSTLKLGKAKDGAAQERQYPMKFLLDHTLLSVAKGKWERVLTQDSRWWRRDAARLRYEVGEGAGLEDMRYQVHVYRRL